MTTTFSVTDERKTTKVRDIPVGKACIFSGNLYVRVKYAASAGIVRENPLSFVKFPGAEIVVFTDSNIAVVPTDLALNAIIPGDVC